MDFDNPLISIYHCKLIYIEIYAKILVKSCSVFDFRRHTFASGLILLLVHVELTAMVYPLEILLLAKLQQ